MLHLLYILAFTVLAFVAVGNLVRNLLSFSADARGMRSPNPSTPPRPQPTPHPELLDESGRAIEEPLLVMKSIGIEDAREQLDALYRSSPGVSTGDDDDTPPPSTLV
ncbi:hypothetical protein CKA32_004428 [Geitlerinema sp. FC II]|nr:DUF2973 domain-containing protein [Geitlerinema sp. CS-897]PPT11318.1 hypothetical protein CKA32_004428 [Geitlerinema sp. FC II]